MASVGEFVATLIVDGSTASVSVKDLVSRFGDLEVATLGEIGLLAEIGMKLAAVAEQAIQTAVGFQRFEAQTGLSAQELQKWQIAAGMANVSADEVSSSVLALQKNLAAIRMGEGNIAPFQLLGIGANQDAFGVLSQLRERLKGVDAATASNVISKMGLGPGMLQVLRLSNEEFAKFQNTAKGMNSSQEGAFLRTQEGLNRINMRLRETGYALASGVMPIAERAFDRFADIAQNVNKFKTEWMAAAAALALVFAPVEAAVAGLLLVLEDIYTYSQGGKSMTGSLLSLLGGKASDPDSFAAAQQRNKDATAAGQNLSFKDSWLGHKLIALTQNINVQSTAPAHDVAHQVKEEAKRNVDQAAQQIP